MQWGILYRRDENAKEGAPLDTNFTKEQAQQVIRAFVGYKHKDVFPIECKLYGIQLAAGNHIRAAKLQALNIMPNNTKLWAQNTRVFWNVTEEEYNKVCGVYLFLFRFTHNESKKVSFRTTLPVPPGCEGNFF